MRIVARHRADALRVLGSLAPRAGDSGLSAATAVRAKRQMRTVPAQSTPHKYAACRCQSDVGLVSDLAVAQPAHARTRLRYGVSRPSRRAGSALAGSVRGDPLTQLSATMSVR